MSDLRREYHEEIDGIRQRIVRLGGSVIEAIPRATAILLDGDLEGADYLISADDEIDARALDLEEECYRVHGPPGPDGRRLPDAGLGGQDRGRDRAVRRPGREHLQGGPPPLRPRVWTPASAG